MLNMVLSFEMRTALEPAVQGQGQGREARAGEVGADVGALPLAEAGAAIRDQVAAPVVLQGQGGGEDRAQGLRRLGIDSAPYL
jgi:hypothetical protein